MSKFTFQDACENVYGKVPEVRSSASSLRLVAKWCEDRARQTEDRLLLKRLWNRYPPGRLQTPFERFAIAVQSEVDEKTEFWMYMAEKFRSEADNGL